jgi:hypothetical protein
MKGGALVVGVYLIGDDWSEGRCCLGALVPAQLRRAAAALDGA